MKAVKFETSYIANNNRKIGLLLLASGYSTRMGQSKLLLPWKGKTIIEHALSLGSDDMFSSKLMVVPSLATRLSDLGRAYGWEVCANEEPSRGQSSSIAVGLDDWERTGVLSSLDGIICMVGDQPLLCVEVLQRLIKHYEKDKIIVPWYESHPGNPVLFSSLWFSSLRLLEGDEGGRSLLRGKGKSAIQYIEFPFDWGRDVDTWEEYIHIVTNS